jgi:hypothetical protein
VAGQIHKLIQNIIETRSKGSETIRNTTRAKLIIKGINPDKYTSISEDNPETIAKLYQIAGEMGVKI